MKRFLIFVLISALFCVATLQGVAQDCQTFKLWPDGAPNKSEAPGPEKSTNDGLLRIENITEAELYVYLPEKKNNTGAAVVICPGGGYWIEAIEHEGHDIAKFLKSQGIAGIVLKYRLPYGNAEVPLSDALQAIRFVRSKAAEWGIKPDRVGIAGASAGGHLASTAGTHFDEGNPNSAGIARLSSRPDFMLLLYPVISFDESLGHIGSRENLIGKTHDWKTVSRFCNELQVTDRTPPVFFILSDDDSTVNPLNSIRFYMALKQHNIPAELHIYQHGGHGFGMKDKTKPVTAWPSLFITWLKEMKII
ncbi:MAG: alpha/beta hydrolase [Bacteroidales bacterium]|jgi:acetyl esterase/lipase|nr:alpha/beta hydrolase [Bacteroidales bacterium]